MLCKAEKIDGSGEIEGYLHKHLDEYSIFKDEVAERWGELTTISSGYKIKPETLKYSFDGGKSWYSEDKIQIILARREAMAIKGVKQ